MNEPATEKQIFLMNKLKIAFNPNVTKQEASKLIDAKMGTKPKDVTTDYKAVDTEMTKSDWEAKDRRYYKTQCLIATNGNIELAQLCFEWVMK